MQNDIPALQTADMTYARPFVSLGKIAHAAYICRPLTISCRNCLQCPCIEYKWNLQYF